MDTCTSCGRETEHPHTGEWIAAKTTTSVSYGPRIANMREKTTTTYYRDAALLRVSLCDQCMADQVRRSVRKIILILAGLLLLLSLVSLIAATSPQAPAGLRIFFAVFVFAAWGFLLYGWMSVSPWIRKGRVHPKDEVHLGDYALRRARQIGKDAVFTPAQWEQLRQKYEEESRKAARDSGT